MTDLSALHQIARQLAPAYMRVSGTWANTTYLPGEGEDIATLPEMSGAGNSACR